MRDTFSAAPWVDALTLPAFLAMLTTGRLFGDRLVSKYGPVKASAGLMTFAFAGLGLVLLAHDAYSAILGFALIGFGVSILFPQTMSAAAGIGDRPASENVASISIVTTIIMLGAPGAIGFIAQSYGIHAAFFVLLPFFVMGLLLTPRLGKRYEVAAAGNGPSP